MVGRWLIYLGTLLIIIGLLILYSGKLQFLGKLPGDFVLKREHFTIYFPLMSSILVSVVITLIFYLVQKLR